MNFRILFLLLFILLLSCKEEQKFDYSLLEGHWLLDSLYINIQDKVVDEKINNDFKFYSFSNDLVFDTRLDNSNIDSLTNLDMFFNLSFDKVIPEYYERINDSIYLFQLNIDTTIVTNTRYKLVFLKGENLVLSFNNNQLFYTKQDFKKVIPEKTEFISNLKNKINYAN